jgi:hypothetical protein
MVDKVLCKNRFVYSDSIAAKKIIDSKTYLTDKENFILKLFFSNEPYC